MTQPNPSTAQARAMADELWRQGVDFAVISPGSRSAALAIALEEHPGITTRVVLDERSAAFRALGRSRVTGLPSVVLATSGTAVANHLPAVVEADLSLVPLITISADRPPELLHVGANQTIEQPGLFGDRVRFSVDLPPAEPGADLEAFWRTTVSQVVARSLGHGARPGPVHVNVAFREPTVPVSDDGRARAQPYPHPIEGRSSGAAWQRSIRARPGRAPLDLPEGRGLLVAGEGDYDPAALMEAAQGRGWPVLATGASGLRRFGGVVTYHHLLVDGVPERLRPDFVITVGRVGPSDRLAALTALPVPQIHIDPWGEWQDPRRHTAVMVEGDPVATLGSAPGAGDTDLAEEWGLADDLMRAALDEQLGGEAATGPAVARALSGLQIDVLAVASSLPVRDVDAGYTGTARVIANRGASGIDGFVSTALGAASTGGRVVALAGDLAFLHDLPGLIGDLVDDLVLVVVDNGGGGLFDLLPQARHAPGYERLFVAPHDRDLIAIGSALGLGAIRLSDVSGLGAEVDARLTGQGAHLIVVPVDRERDLKMRRSLDEVARSVARRFS